MSIEPLANFHGRQRQRLACSRPRRRLQVARYFFNVRDGFVRIDHDGTELAGLVEARHAAMQISSELLKRDEHTFWDDPNWHIEVTDDRGLILFTLHISATESPATAGRRRA
jgi:hypothetical protein